MDAVLSSLVLGQAESQRVARVEWLNLPESWGVFLFLFVVVAIMTGIVWLYILEMSSCPLAVRLLLAMLRGSVAALLIIAYLKPSITYVENRVRRPNFVLLRDASQSMSNRDRYRDQELASRVATALRIQPSEVQDGGLSRADVTDRALRVDDGALLEAMRRKGSLRVINFAGDADPLVTLPSVSGDDANSDVDEDADVLVDGTYGLPDLNPVGTRTDIWQALKTSLNVGQLRGVVLFSDGQHTSSDLPTEVAELAAQMSIPIYVVGVGDPARVRNVSVAEVWVLSKARPNEPFEIDFLVSGEDVLGQTVSVELLRQRVDENSGELGELTTVSTETRQITFSEETGNVRDQFTHFEPEVGRYRYSVRISQVENEEELDDNIKLSSEVDVTQEKVKVLLIAGAPTWEYRMVQRLLQRDQNITLSCWLQTMDPERPQEGNEPISVLPRTFEQLAPYNVILMFDPNPDEFDEEWIDALTRFASDKGGGLLYMAGPKYTSLFLSLRRTSDIKDLVPVVFGSDADSEVAQYLASSNTTASNLSVSLQNLEHQVMNFPGDRNDNLRIWQGMPGIYWSYPARHAKPTTQVLIEHGDITLSADGEHARPLLVAGRYGAGNTIYLGFNGTWRWRRVGRQAEYFDRFWIQVCNYLVNTRSVQGLRRGTVDPDRDEYELGDTIEFYARLFDPRYEPLGLEEVPAYIRYSDGQPLPLTFYKVPNQDGNYRATFPAQKIGQFQLQIELQGARDEQQVDPISVNVKPPQIETRARWLNERLLEEIATTSGGKYYHIDELPELIDDLPDLTESVEWRSLPEPVWSLNRFLEIAVFVLPVLLLGVEWALRKGFKLL